MKLLNERTIAQWIRSCPADKEGILYKRGNEYNRAFKKRYFILCSNILCYYSSLPDQHATSVSSSSIAGGSTASSNSSAGSSVKPIGVIFLEGHTVELAEESGELSVFVLSFPNMEDSESRKYILGAATPEEAVEWTKSLMCAGTDYFKCTNIELGEQLSKLTLSITNTVQGDQESKKSDSGKPELRFNPFDDSQPRSRTHSSLLSAQLDAQMFGDQSSGNVFFPSSPNLPQIPSFEELRNKYAAQIQLAAGSVTESSDNNNLMN